MFEARRAAAKVHSNVMNAVNVQDSEVVVAWDGRRAM